MLLTVDRGNSTLDCMLWDGERPDRRERIDPADDAAIAAFLAGASVTDAVGVAVVDGGVDGIAAALGSTPLRRVGRDVDVPLETVYADPSTLGADRLVTGFAGFCHYGSALVVDCGSAITANLVSESEAGPDRGLFCGGAIAPGIPALVAGMGLVTPALPAADPAADFEVPARSTADAVTAGVVLGFCAIVDGLVERIVAEADLILPPKFLITGGNAETYLRHRPGSTFEHVPDLMHRGLRELARSGSGDGGR